MELSSYIDHTLLNPESRQDDFVTLVDEAVTYGFYTVCVPPSLVSFLKRNYPNLRICSVASFPLGYSDLRTKKSEILSLYAQGALEVDVVLNRIFVKTKDWQNVEKEFRMFSKIAKSHCLKVIIESGELTPNEIKTICHIANDNPVTFLKTSTGFSKTPATLSAVEIMKTELGSSIQIKASGGIRDADTAWKFIHAGASRLGCSASVAIVKGKNNVTSRSTY